MHFDVSDLSQQIKTDRQIVLCLPSFIYYSMDSLCRALVDMT